ncbi:uncharacterized protein LOC111252086 isoform X1 [Varroa destructor]|uniref:Uncharacterized protein n=1 Tax=Varroa destructor TaxID=109461 RepID=A0A7M7KDH6_VARDE|nr:uncharacterized protein LOC111252086 isoform X1 [Varroa destructor]
MIIERSKQSLGVGRYVRRRCTHISSSNRKLHGGFKGHGKRCSDGGGSMPVYQQAKQASVTTRRPTWARASTIVLGRPIASFREPHLKAEDGKCDIAGPWMSPQPSSQHRCRCNRNSCVSNSTNSRSNTRVKPLQLLYRFCLHRSPPSVR